MNNLIWTETINKRSKDIQAFGTLFDFLIEVDSKSISSYIKPNCLIGFLIAFLSAPITALRYGRPNQYILAGTDWFKDFVNPTVTEEILLEVANNILRTHQKEAEELEQSAVNFINSYKKLAIIFCRPEVQTILGITVIFVIFLVMILSRTI